MRKREVLECAISLCAGLAGGYAQGQPIPPAGRQEFVNVFTASCVKHLSGPGILRERLAHNERLDQAQSRDMLLGLQGDAWILPDDDGPFVIALASATPLCVISRTGEDIESAQRNFHQRMSAAPPPLLARRLEKQADKSLPATAVTTYTWELPGASWVYVFKLVTESSATTQGKPVVVGIAAVANRRSPTALEAKRPMDEAGPGRLGGGT